MSIILPPQGFASGGSTSTTPGVPPPYVTTQSTAFKIIQTTEGSDTVQVHFTTAVVIDEVQLFR